MKATDRRLTYKLPLGVLHILWQCLFFGVPLIVLSVMSLQQYELGQPQPGITTANYSSLASSPFPKSVLNSLVLSALVGISATLLGTASVMSAWLLRRPTLRSLLLTTCSIVFFAGVMPRTYALQFLLSYNGPLRILWEWLPVPQGRGLLNSASGVFFASLALVLPLVMVVLYVFRNAIQQVYLECARDLGANELTIQLRIVLPLLKPGIIAAFIMSFIVTLGDVVAVVLIGGARIYTAPMQILDYIRIDDWGKAAAGSLVLLLIAVFFITVGAWVFLHERLR